MRKSGGRVRITAQLIDSANNNHLWAERYDRDLNDIFSLQDEISEAIVKALRVKLLPEEKRALGQRGTDSVEAYNLYLMACSTTSPAMSWMCDGRKPSCGSASAQPTSIPTTRAPGP